MSIFLLNKRKENPEHISGWSQGKHEDKGKKKKLTPKDNSENKLTTLHDVRLLEKAGFFCNTHGNACEEQEGWKDEGVSM